jgi:hypothetical protein
MPPLKENLDSMMPVDGRQLPYHWKMAFVGKHLLEDEVARAGFVCFKQILIGNIMANN